MDLQADLRARWRPTDEQTAAADQRLTQGATEVFTGHLLLNKEFGFWTQHVVVVAIAGVYGSLEEAWSAVGDEVRKCREGGIKKVTGGYARHSAPGEWAVFEDIASAFPRDDV